MRALQLICICMALLVCRGADCGTTERATCADYRASGYAVLFTAHFFAVDWIEADGPGTPPEVRALRCMTQEPASLGWLKDLIQHGTLPGQLYGLVGLRALDREEFNRNVVRYLSNEESVVRTGGDIAVSHPASAIAAEIGRGSYVRKFLPAFKNQLADDQPHFELRAPDRK